MKDYRINKLSCTQFDRSGKVDATHKVGKDLWQALTF